MQKIRYELDPYNRLVVKSGKKSALARFRKVIDGRFKIGKNNELSYHVKSPLSPNEKIPNQIKLRGRWSLTKNHDLRLTFDKEYRKTLGDKITLQGEILGAAAHSLLFAITTKTKEGVQKTYTLNLGGVWRADKNNRLSFHIKREKQRTDILTFKSSWEINKNHEIIYRYEKALLIRKKRKTHTLEFKGHWDVKDKFRISYMLSKSMDSGFNFYASAGGLGAGIKNNKPVLFGEWKIKKGAKFTFKIELKKRNISKLILGVEGKLTDRDTILCRLKKDVAGKGTGVTVKLSRKILKGNGLAFVRLLKEKRESSVYAGAAWRW